MAEPDHAGSSKAMDYYTKLKQGLSSILQQNAKVIKIEAFGHSYLRSTIINYKRLAKKYEDVFKINEVTAEELINEGVDFNKTNIKGNTALHCAVIKNNYDLAAMLLYYNADATIANNERRTPFMLAVELKNHAMQSLLLEYETDFNRTFKIDWLETPLLELAVERKSKLIEEILIRCACASSWDMLIFLTRGILRNFDTFRMIWEKIEHEDLHRSIFYSAISFDIEYDTKKIFEYIVKSDRLQLILDDTYAMYDQRKKKWDWDIQFYFLPIRIIQYAISRFPREKSFEMIYILLMHGYEPYYSEVEVIFETFGNCQLFDLCLEVELRPSSITYSFLLLSIILDLSKTVREHIERFMEIRIKDLNLYKLTSNIEYMVHFSCNDYMREKFLQELGEIRKKRREIRQYFAVDDDIDKSIDDNPILDSPTMEKLNRNLPSLQELSRDVTREYICKKYCITNYSDFRRVLRALKIGQFEKILTLHMPIYH